MRSLLLFLSKSQELKRWTSRSRFAQITARRFVAGEVVDQASAVIHDLNQRGMTATLDHLGENTESEPQAIAAAEEYLVALEHIAQHGVKSSISVKLTQLGLDLGIDLCRRNVAQIADKAKEMGTFVRIDMESSDYTDATFDVLYAVRKDHNNVAIVIQAYLYRSRSDVASLIEAGIPVRLCKGAYQEPAAVAYPGKTDVDNNMIDLMHLIFSEKARKNGARLAMATHDEKLIAATKAYAAAHDIPKTDYEFQMLFGIRPALQQRLVHQGYGMRVYVPYGTEWYPYLMRRLAERPANLWFILTQLLRR